MSLSLRRYHPAAQAIIIGIPVLILASLAWVLVAGDGAESPPWHGSEVRTLTVCAPHDPEPWMGAAQGWVGAGWTVPAVRAGDCSAPPAPGEVQVRACGAVVEGLGSGCLERREGTSALRGSPVSSGAIYAEERAAGCMRAHEIGHVLGLGHTLAATSVMAGTDHGEGMPCGSSWALVRRELYPEVP